ncbi:hypothetical protein HAX54_009481 [Datura stramonium]|uniref:Uncharacterized protein n=1 Tax=Datura stramonium TaxID=4076 RepID=A0ABS8THL9_DATST|nr:hypothetical protein [Datura stramonium]
MMASRELEELAMLNWKHRRNTGKPQKVIRGHRRTASDRQRTGGKLSTGDRSAIRQSQFVKRRCDVGSKQWPEANISPNQRFIGVSPDLTGGQPMVILPNA